MTKLENKIQTYCEENNLAFGIASPEPFSDIAAALAKCAEDFKGFVHKDLEKRIDPRKILESAKSIIVIAKSYNKKISLKQDGQIRCKIALGSFEEDYHGVLKAHLEDIIRIISENFPNSESLSFVDTGPLDDRAAAKRAGVGTYGKNGMLITEKLGSAVNLGCIITDLELPAHKPLERELCTNCGKCVKACPHGALTEAGYDFRRCISYISQKKGDLEEWEKEILGNALYGCDICLRACPCNNEFFGEVTDLDEMYPTAESILALTNSTFKKKYAHTSFAWRGLKIMKRNARNAIEKGMIY